MVEGENGRRLALAADHRITARREGAQARALVRRWLHRSEQHVAKAWIGSWWSKVRAAKAARNRGDDRGNVSRLASLGRCDDAAVVGIADGRHLPVAVHEPQSVLGPGRKPIFGGRRQIVLLSVGKGRDQEQLDGEGGIGRRLLGADPVRVNLTVDFGEQFAPVAARADPPRRRSPAPSSGRRSGRQARQSGDCSPRNGAREIASANRHAPRRI